MQGKIYLFYSNSIKDTINILINKLCNYLDEEWKFLGTLIIKTYEEKKAYDKVRKVEVTIRRSKLISLPFSEGLKVINQLISMNF